MLLALHVTCIQGWLKQYRKKRKTTQALNNTLYINNGKGNTLELRTLHT